MNREVLAKIFNQPDLVCNKDNDCKREKFLSRLFGILSEEIVKVWCDNCKSPYKDLGRPSLYEDGKYTGTTLDFTFKDRITDKIYIVEMKCEIQYENFKYFYLSDDSELNRFLDHHNKKAFERFKKLPTESDKYIIKYPDPEFSTKKKQLDNIDGIILIWGKVDQEKIENKKIESSSFNFHQILSVERMISDLIEWEDEDYKCMIDAYQCWSNDMFDQLVGKPSKKDECRKQTVSCQNK